jgi:hypothetical protein
MYEEPVELRDLDTTLAEIRAANEYEIYPVESYYASRIR